MFNPAGMLVAALGNVHDPRQRLLSAVRVLFRAPRQDRGIEADEPALVAEAAKRLGLKHVVITNLTRDDLPDGGAAHFRRTVEAVRAATNATIEVLVPDFIGEDGALERLMESRPEAFNHNTETVPRLYSTARGRKRVYAWTLELPHPRHGRGQGLKLK